MIILASASPRRREILASLGVDFKIITADTDEHSSITDPEELAEELAVRKGRAVYELLCRTEPDMAKDAVIISADTVVYAQGEVLGKPRDHADAFRMLRSLSGSSHCVVSGIAVTVGGDVHSDRCVTRVNVEDIPEKSLIAYADSDEPMDKAGAYAIQGRFAPWVRSIEGCYQNVVGLPVNHLNKLFFEATGKYLV